MKEMVRKSIHMMIAVVPTMAQYNFSLTVLMLSAGVVFYAYTEYLRSRGIQVAFISGLTVIASRDRDNGTFVLGPVTLGIGALLALLLYPNPAAQIGIYALAFGDGLSSLGGKLIPSPKVPFLRGKTMAGSSVCFWAVFISSYLLTGEIRASLILACTATALEAIPVKDFDNIIIPIGTGFVARLVL
ncbi:MAG: phosphatidate cytidylyltransferase [Spirochaetales bacterium]|nr:phosphatidate cytidylyltransferase [Spirochaetales bacterium]